MKSIKYIIVPALAAFLFTACNNEVKGPSQADLDAQVEAKVKSATDQLKSECDARIQQAAQLQADSIVAKAAGKKVTPAPAPKPAPAPAAHTNPKHTTPVPTKKTETQVVKDRFKTDVKKEVKDVKDRFDSKKPTEQKVKEEVQEVKSRFNK